MATDLGPTPKNSSKLFYKPAANIFKELQILSSHVQGGFFNWSARSSVQK